MSTLRAFGLGDFSHILEFHNNFNSSEPSPLAEESHATPAPATANTRFEKDGTTSGGVALGDFTRVWQLLGTRPPTPSSSTDDIFGTLAKPVATEPSDSVSESSEASQSAEGKPLTKTQRKKANRKARKEKEKDKEEQAASLLHDSHAANIAHSTISITHDSGVTDAAAKVSPAKALDPISAWQNATTALPRQFAANMKAANEKRKMDAAKPLPPVDHKFKETFKKTAPNRGRLGASRKYDATEYTIHDVSGSRSVQSLKAVPPAQAPVTPEVKAKQKVEKPDQVTPPTTDDEQTTAQAVNAVQLAMASLKRNIPTPSPNTGLPRTKTMPHTPVQKAKQVFSQSQPKRPKTKNSTTPKQIKNMHLMPSTVGVQPTRSNAVHAALQHVALFAPNSVVASTSPKPMLIPGPRLKPPSAIEPLIQQSEEDRHWILLNRLLDKFPENRKHLVSPMNMTHHNKDPKGIHVFVDASNIFIGFMDALKQARGIHPLAHMPQANLSFAGLALLMERRRPIAKRVLAGSNPWLPAFDAAKSVGYEMNILDKVHKARELTERQIYFKELDARRYGKGSKAPAVHNAIVPTSPTARYSVLGNIGGSGTETSIPQYAPAKMIEQGVDEILHLKISHSLLDYEEPSTIVLATGDAALAEYSDGFMAMVERALRKGWHVELVSWEKNISKTYLKSDWVNSWEGRFKIIYLDEFAEELLCA